MYTNVDITDCVLTFTSDTRFGLVDLGQGWLRFCRARAQIIEEILSRAHQSFKEQIKF
jgi:hypothetical protein